MMSLSKREFELLVYLYRHGEEKLSQRKLAEGCRLSLGSVNATLQTLRQNGLVALADDHKPMITDRGREALEPYRVRRAIFLAAGFGSRLVPVTLKTPKPLIPVQGKRIIETMLDAVVAAGIPEIYLVRGYLGEQFDALKEKYPQLVLIDNPDYRESNNISSAMLVKDLFGGAYVLDSDLYLMNPELIRPFEYTSSYTGVYVDKTDDWRLIMKSGKITGMKIGGTDCYHMYNITFWRPEDGEKFAKFLPELYASPGGKENYWDNVPLEHYNRYFDIEVREILSTDILEIDTLSELQAADPAYCDL